MPYLGSEWEHYIDSRFILSKNNYNKRFFFVDFCEDFDIKGEVQFEIREKDIHFHSLD